MRKCNLFIFAILICTIVLAQRSPSITLSFSEAPISEVIAQIEGTTPYRFYYVAEWLGEQRITNSYKAATIQTVLQDIFQDTEINFYVLDGTEIILIRNNTIYNTLPGGFFKRSDGDSLSSKDAERTTEAATFSGPILYSGEEVPSNQEIMTVRIGKDTGGVDKKQTYSLSGFVTEADSGEAISDLSVFVGSKGIGTVTDSTGFYKLELPRGIYILEARALGVASLTKRVLLFSGGRLDFELDEGFEQLDEVVVEGDRNRNIEEEITGSTTIDAEDTKDIPLVLGERNLLTIAATLPGITNAGEGATGLNVRGGKTDQNLILLDDAVVYNPTHFFGIFQALNPFTTKEVDIYKGNIPPKFGGRLSSVFDISTIDGDNEKFSGEASIGPVTGNLSLEIPVVKGKSSLVLGGRGAYSDWILRSLEEESLRNSSASFYDLIANYTHNINDNNSLKTTSYFSDDRFSITSDSLFEYSNRALSLKWDHIFNAKNRGSLILANSRYAFDIAFDGSSNNDFDLGYDIDETELKLQVTNFYKERHAFDYGLAAKLYSVNPGFIEPNGPESNIRAFSVPDDRALEGAVFFGNDFTVGEKLGFSLGLRYSFYAALGKSVQNVYEEGQPRNEGTRVDSVSYNRNELIKTYGGPELRLSGRFSLSPDFSVKAGFNSTYQYIHTLSNTTTVSPIDTWKLSDTNIRPQRAFQYTLGLFKNFKDTLYELIIEGYFKTAEDILDFKTGAQLLLNENIETEVLQGEGKAYGVEFLLRKNSGKLNGWLGYTYSRSLIRFDNDFSENRINGGVFFPSNYDKPHDFSLVSNYKFTKRYSASFNFSYQTGRPVTYPIGQYNFNNSEYVFYSNRNEFRIPDYYRLDIGINIEGNHRIKKFAHSFWNISVYNVLGRANPYSVFFVSEVGEVKAFKSSIFAVPIPSITYNFKF